jgi:hypothetical protein
VFLWLALLSMAGAVWLVAKYWTPLLFHAGAIALVLTGLWFSQPFGYAMYLVQTHALFFFLTIAGLVLAERGRPIAGGALVACAAAVKLTPGILVVYWLVTRRWKAAFSVVLTWAGLMLLTYLAVGPRLTAAYLADLHRVSGVLLVAQNNQSFAAWAMDRFYPPDAVFDVTILPLPALVRVGSMLLMVGFTAAGALVDRIAVEPDSPGNGLRRPPLGAMVALIAMTIFAPIAWTHYSIVLVAPVMVLAAEALRLRNRWRWAVAGLTAAALLLNYPPLATNVITMDIADSAVVRGQFFSALLCLGGLAVAAAGARRRAVHGGEPRPA